MEIKLNIPKKDNKREIEKTYTADIVDVPFGSIMNLSKSLDFDNLKDVDNKELGFALIKNLKEIEDIFCYIFEGLTPEEFGRVGTIKIIPVVFQIIKNVKEEITKEVKNVMGEHKE